MEIFRQTPLDQGRLETCKQWPDFDHVVSHTIGGETATDLWMMMTNYEPDLNDGPVVRAAFDALLEIPELGTIRKACAGDPALSAAVTVMLKDFSKEAGRAIDEAGEQHEKEKADEEGQPGEGEGDGEGQPQEGDGDGKGEPSPGDGTPGDTGQGKGEGGQDHLGSGSSLSPGTEQALKDALKQAAEKWLDGETAEERVNDLAAGFSLAGDTNPSLRDRIQIAESDTANMQQILKLVGVLRKTVAETGRYIRASAPNATLNKPGRDGGLRALGMLDNREIADLAAGGVSEALFWQRWKNRQTRVTKTWGKVPAGAGPIVLMGDESSSMPAQEAKFPDTHESLTPADWLVALALATAAQCEAERRPFVYQAWASRIHHTRRFESKAFGGLTADQKIRMATEHGGGGTNLQLAINHGIIEAVRLSHGRKVKADIIVVTDGDWILNQRAIAEIKDKLEETKIKAHLFLVCNRVETSQRDKGFWTTVIDVKDLLSSSVAVGKIMA